MLRSQHSPHNSLSPISLASWSSSTTPAQKSATLLSSKSPSKSPPSLSSFPKMLQHPPYRQLHRAQYPHPRSTQRPKTFLNLRKKQRNQLCNILKKAKRSHPRTQRMLRHQLLKRSVSPKTPEAFTIKQVIRKKHQHRSHFPPFKANGAHSSKKSSVETLLFRFPSPEVHHNSQNKAPSASPYDTPFTKNVSRSPKAA